MEHLPLAEFTYNNTVNSSTGMTPFFATRGLHPVFDPVQLSLPAVSPPVTSSAELVSRLHTLREDLQANLRSAQESYSASANRKRRPFPVLAVGDSVFLKTTHLKSVRPSKKLSEKYLGPFNIIQVVNPVAYKLQLPATMRIHPVFHSSLLHPRSKDTFAEQLVSPPPPVLIDDALEFSVDAIIDS